MGDYAALQREVVRRVGVSAGQIVLDGGTGPEASFAVRLAEAVGEGLMIAIDFNKNYIPQIKKSILRADARIVFLLSDLTWIPLQSNSVDIATSLDAMQNMFSKDVVQKVILEMKRVVKPQGKTAIGSRLPVARNRAQETYLKLHNFEYELERIMWGEEQRFYNENEFIRMF